MKRKLSIEEKVVYIILIILLVIIFGYYFLDAYGVQIGVGL